MSNRDNASTFAKGLAVLACFEGGRDDLTMADVAHLTGFDRATARRLCLTLETCGYLYKRGRFLRLTPRILAVTGGYLASEDIGRTIQPVLNHFAEELQGEIALAVRDGTRAIYIAQSAVASARRSLGFSVGSTLPLLPTAVGRMLLASLTSDARDRIVQCCEIKKFTEVTNLDLRSIRQDIAIAADQGYAYVTREFEMAAAGLAVPIPNISGTEAALATTTSVNQMSSDNQIDHTLDILRRAAMRLSV